MKKFRNKYRIETCRLKNWDYRNKGSYFVTIVTKNRKHHFGTIQNKQMQLSPIGQIADKYWREIPNHFSFVQLDAFVIMPDHIHGIITIKDSPSGEFCLQTPNLGISTNPDSGVSTRIAQTTNLGVLSASKKWKSGHLGIIINQYKRIVTIESRKINSYFGWLPRYYEHIIQDSRAFNNISKYIRENPQNWEK